MRWAISRVSFHKKQSFKTSVAKDLPQAAVCNLTVRRGTGAEEGGGLKGPQLSREMFFGYLDSYIGIFRPLH